MTFGQMYSFMQTCIDKAGSAYFPQSQFDQVASAIYNDMVEFELAKLEQDEEYTTRVEYLYKVIQKTNVAQIVEETDCPNFRKRIRLNIRYKLDCNGKVTYPYSPVIKARNNEVDEMQNDPFNVGNDSEPNFVVTKNASDQTIWQINSTSTPLEINATYCRNPQAINSANNPNTIFEAPDYIAQELSRFIAQELNNIIENFNRSAMSQKFMSRFVSVPGNAAQ